MLFWSLKLSRSFQLGAQNKKIFTYGTFKNLDVKETMDDNKQIKNNALL
jgi:hypothetical protein